MVLFEKIFQRNDKFFLQIYFFLQGLFLYLNSSYAYYLKNEYDYVILDTPPIQPVSDTLFISQATDHNIIIARSRFTKLVGIKSALKKLNSVNAKVDGVLFNDLDTSRASYYGYYQYGGYYKKYKSYT